MRDDLSEGQGKFHPKFNRNSVLPVLHILIYIFIAPVADSGKTAQTSPAAEGEQTVVSGDKNDILVVASIFIVGKLYLFGMLDSLILLQVDSFFEGKCPFEGSAALPIKAGGDAAFPFDDFLPPAVINSEDALLSNIQLHKLAQGQFMVLLCITHRSGIKYGVAKLLSSIPFKKGVPAEPSK